MQAMVSTMLGDAKLEVREVAAVTLAGLLKGVAPHQAQQLRDGFQADVARFSGRRRRRTTAGAAAAGAGLPRVLASTRLCKTVFSSLPWDSLNGASATETPCALSPRSAASIGSRPEPCALSPRLAASIGTRPFHL